MYFEYHIWKSGYTKRLCYVLVTRATGSDCFLKSGTRDSLSLVTKYDFLLVFSFSQHQRDLNVVRPKVGLAVMTEMQLVLPTINSSGKTVSLPWRVK